MMTLSIEEMASFCKRRGFTYPNSEIYGGLAGFWDFGPLGVELKNNIKKEWWKAHVESREDIVGIDGSIINSPKVWKASGHAECFSDLMLTTKRSKTKLRADQFIEDQLKINVEGKRGDEINELIKRNNLRYNGEEFLDLKDFNLMFETQVGPDGNLRSYLRPETAQLIFTNFRLVVENERLKLPFGIAQIGKAFRNEISPRDFLFRCREFEQMEIEYFIDPHHDSCPYVEGYLDHEINVCTEEMQKDNKEHVKLKISEAIKKGMTKWHAYWLSYEHQWFVSLGAKADNFRVREHVCSERSHYASSTWDLEYRFPFGWKELEGIANRTDFDLQQHMKHSGKDLSLYDDVTKKKIVPHVVCEPSLGVERTFLVFMFDAYFYDKERENIVLKLHPKLAPIKVAVLPLVKNKPELVKKAREVYGLLKDHFACKYDEVSSVGKRYYRHDEQGTPLAVTIDFDSLEKGDVTLRERDSAKQIRVKIPEMKEIISKLLEGEKLMKFGELIN